MLLMFGARNIMSGISGRSRRSTSRIRPPVGLHSSRLTLESNYNDRRRNPSLGRESSWRGVPGDGWRSRGTPTRRAPSRAAYPARLHPLARAVRTPTPTHRNNPICKNPPFSRTAVGLYGGGDGGVDSRPCLFQFLFV